MRTKNETLKAGRSKPAQQLLDLTEDEIPLYVVAAGKLRAPASRMA